MATLSNVLSFARAQAQTDSNGLTDANGIIFANEALLDFHRKFITSGIDASQLQESYYNPVTVPTDGNGSTFLYPADMFFLKSIEVNYADTNAQNYRVAKQVDVSNIPGDQSFSWLRKNASKDSPQFDDRGDWFELFPAFTSADNLTNAVRIFYYLEPTEYTSTSDTISYPISLDYRTIGWRIASSYYYSLNKFEEGDAFNNRYEEKVQDMIATLGRGSAQPVQATPIQLTGWEF